MLLFLFKYWRPIVAGVFSILSLFLASYYPNPIYFSAIIAVWLGLCLWLFNWWHSDKKLFGIYMISIVFSVLGFVGTYSILEWGSIKIFMNLLVGLIIGVVFLVPQKFEESEIYEYKPWRRMLMMIIVFNAYLLLTILFGIDIFFNNFSQFWILSIVGGLVSSVSGVMIWRLYYPDRDIRGFLLWGMLSFLVVFELMWVFKFLPFGYLVLGLLVAWVWYILQLFIRFHISKKGIIWRKQKVFLIGNAILFLSFLFFIRWI